MRVKAAMKIILMVSSIVTTFSSLMAHSKEPTMYPRVVQLPDAELRFSMTEDFSKDMPAEPLAEKVTADMLTALKMPGDRFVIGRRWWDIKPPGWFKKSLGSMQLTVSLGANVGKNGEALDFCDAPQKEFLTFYHESLIEKWREHNAGISSENKLQFGVNVYPLFGGRGQEFIPYAAFKKASRGTTFLEAVAGQGGNIYHYYSLPVDSKLFLEFEFIGAPDLNGYPYHFQDLVMERVRRINDSVLVVFGKENCLASGLASWIEASSVELLKPDPSLLPKPIPVEEFLKANGLKELPGTKELLGEKENK